LIWVGLARGVARSKYVGWTHMASAEPITGVSAGSSGRAERVVHDSMDNVVYDKKCIKSVNFS